MEQSVGIIKRTAGYKCEERIRLFFNRWFLWWKPGVVYERGNVYRRLWSGDGL